MFTKRGFKFVLALGLILGTGVPLGQSANRSVGSIRGVASVADDGHSVQTFSMPAGELTLLFGQKHEIAAVSYRRADGRVSMELVDQKGSNGKRSKNDIIDDEHEVRCIRCYDNGTWGIWAVYDKDGVLIGYLIIDKDGDVHFSPKTAEK